MPFEIVHGDITKMKVDAVVNAANSALQRGGGVCGAIFSAAGARELQLECNRIGHCDTGRAVITNAFAMDAKHIIHTVGPIWRGGGQNEEMLLYNCYMNSLELAKENGCESIAFPLISSGIFGYPKEQAIEVAKRAIRAFLKNHDMKVQLVIFDRNKFPMNPYVREAIDDYIAEHYSEEEAQEVAEMVFNLPQMDVAESLTELEIEYDERFRRKLQGKRTLDNVLKELDESFSERLLRLIDESSMTDVDIYKRANIDRKLFSKIRKGNGYQPSKTTAVALAIALELSMDDTLDLLKTASLTLSESSTFDLIIRYFIDEEEYDLYTINDALFAFGQKLLGV